MEVIGSCGYDVSSWRIWKEENGKTNVYLRDGNQVYYQETINGTVVNAYSIPESSRAFVYLGNELLGYVKNGMEANFYINDHLGTTELVTDRNGMIKTQIEHSPFGDMVTGGTSVRIEKAINSAGFDPNNTSAIVANGQARPVKSVTEYEQLLYRFNDLTGTSDPHFSTAKEYVYNHNNPDILQLKVVSSLTYAGSNGPVEKIEYLDLTDKPLGQYKIALDFRKDVGGNISTLNDKFEIYISRVNIYSQSQVQTMPIAVEPGTTSFTFAPQGIGLTNVTWLYSQDNGNSWDNIVPGTNTALPNGTGNILIKAIFSPGFYPESPVLNGFKVTFVSTGNGDSEDYFFTGKEKDVTGLYYFGARYYDPEIGRFISEDPGQDGEDWFGYCKNNPLGYFDPDGQVVETPWDAFNVSLDLTFLAYDLSHKDYWGVAVDTVFLIYDGVATTVPFLPAGGGVIKSGMKGTELGIKGSEAALKTASNGKNVVYLSKNAKGVVQYVGITNNFARRAAEHLTSKGIHIEKILANLSRSDARAVEQALIEIYSLEKNGGTLVNKINSIAKTNPIYAKQLERGYELLKSIGYR